MVIVIIEQLIFSEYFNFCLHTYVYASTRDLLSYPVLLTLSMCTTKLHLITATVGEWKKRTSNERPGAGAAHVSNWN